MQDSIAGVPQRISESQVPLWRILGRNPGPMTGPGTNSYLIGESRLCLIDPGPRDSAQLQSFLEAIGDRRLDMFWSRIRMRSFARLLSARHRRRLRRASGAEHGHHDAIFQPCANCATAMCWIASNTRPMLHTPGHVSNHFCYLLCEEEILFTGDHVLQGTTSVILPPDGNMSDYLNSLAELRELPLRYLAPGHGNLIHDPQGEISKLMQHRMHRENKVERGLAGIGNCTLEELVVVVYDDVDKSMHRWACRTMLAHLEKLEREGRARREGERWSPL